MVDYKKIKTFGTKIEAEIAKSFLESQGINSYILADDTANMYPSQDLVSGVHLLVKLSDYIKARQIMDTIDLEESIE